MKTEDYYLEHMIDDLFIDILRDWGWDKLADEYKSTKKYSAYNRDYKGDFYHA